MNDKHNLFATITDHLSKNLENLSYDFNDTSEKINHKIHNTILNTLKNFNLVSKIEFDEQQKILEQLLDRFKILEAKVSILEKEGNS